MRGGNSIHTTITWLQLCKNITHRSKTKRKNSKHEKPSTVSRLIPWETKIGPAILININMVITRFLDRRNHKSLLWNRDGLTFMYTMYRPSYLNLYWTKNRLNIIEIADKPLLSNGYNLETTYQWAFITLYNTTTQLASKSSWMESDTKDVFSKAELRLCIHTGGGNLIKGSRYPERIIPPQTQMPWSNFSSQNLAHILSLPWTETGPWSISAAQDWVPRSSTVSLLICLTWEFRYFHASVYCFLGQFTQIGNRHKIRQRLGSHNGYRICSNIGATLI